MSGTNESQAPTSLQDTVLMKEPDVWGDADPSQAVGMPPEADAAEEAPPAADPDEDELDFGEGQVYKLPKTKIRELAKTGALLERFRTQVQEEWQALQENKEGWNKYQQWVGWMNEASPEKVRRVQAIIAGMDDEAAPAPASRARRPVEEELSILDDGDGEEESDDAEEAEADDLFQEEEEEQPVQLRAKKPAKPAKPDKTALILKSVVNELKTLRAENQRILQEQEARVQAEQKRALTEKVQAFEASIETAVLRTPELANVKKRKVAIENVKLAMRLLGTRDPMVAAAEAAKWFDQVGRKQAREAVSETNTARKANGVVPSGGTAPAPLKEKKKLSFEDPGWAQQFQEALANAR